MTKIEINQFDFLIIKYIPNFGNCSCNVNLVENLLANVIIDIVNSAMRTKLIIIEAININTCAEYKPQINIRHIINVIIDDANKHIDAYRNIHRSYSNKSEIKFLISMKISLTI